MTNKPLALTPKEIKEIASVQRIQDLWGMANSADMEMTLKDIYTVKFQYMNESPGYVGDLFIIQPGVLGSEFPVIRLVRNREKQLEVVE
ncbi:MAG TPA: hypothetical protein VGY98_01595 [Verrucomicrobiae bacterium]|nr:hypothetical protein [Verrucomicrobiae bacterium]